MKETYGVPGVLALAVADWVAPDRAADAARSWARADDALAHPAFYRVFERCLAALPPQAARVFALREIEGRSVGEIARALGLAEADCLALLYAARTRLCEALERHWLSGALD